MTFRTGFLTAGSWVVDRNITVDAWPGEDMLATVQKVELAGGGPGCNFAVAMRRLNPDMPVATQGLIGAGEMGDFLLDVADAHGIDRRGLQRTDAAPTQSTDAYLSARTGRRTHILFPGCGPWLTPDHFDFSDVSARFLHLGLPGIHERMDKAWHDQPNGWVAVLRRARRAGLRCNMELVSAPDEVIRKLVRPCLPFLDTLVVNDSEIGALAERSTVGIDGTDVQMCFEAAEAVLGMGAMEMVVVHFTMGAILAGRDGMRLFIPSVAVPQTELIGSNGAGDAFAAGFFCAHAAGESAETCLRLAHASAAASLRAADTYSGIASATDCLDLAMNWGWRQRVST